MCGGAVLSVSLLLASLLLAGQYPDFDREDHVSTIGRITAVDEAEEVVLVKVGSKTHRITRAVSVPRYVHRVVTLGDVKIGSTIWVLCRYQKATSTEVPGERLAPQYIQINAIVDGPFSPPPLSKKQELARLAWKRGTFSKNPDGTRFSLDSVNMQTGAKRTVISIRRDNNTALKKKSLIRAWGKKIAAPVTEDKKKARRLGKMVHMRAVTIETLAVKAPKQEYAVILGL